MKRSFVLAGFTAAALVTSWMAFSQPGSAGGCGGCEGGCPCGEGPKTSLVPWDDAIATPVEKVADPKAPAAEPSWSADDLKAAKPLLVYYFVKDLTDVKDDSHKVAQKFEMGVLGAEKDDALQAIRNNWRAKKIALDLKADRKDPKNQARIEMWSFTNVKVGEITAKQDDALSPKPFLAKLNAAATKHRDLCTKEIKRMADAEKAKPAPTTGK